MSSCAQHDDRSISNAQLVDNMTDAVTPDQSVLELGKVAMFPWDSLLILNPFSNLDVLSAKLHVDLSEAKQSGIDQRDDIDLLIFFSNGQHVRMVEYPRISGDFIDTTVRFIVRDSAQFKIVETNRLNMAGHKWIELRRR